MKYLVESYISYPKVITVYAEDLDGAEKRANEILSTFPKIVDYEINDIIECKE